MTTDFDETRHLYEVSDPQLLAIDSNETETKEKSMEPPSDELVRAMRHVKEGRGTSAHEPSNTNPNETKEKSMANGQEVLMRMAICLVEGRGTLRERMRESVRYLDHRALDNPTTRLDRDGQEFVRELHERLTQTDDLGLGDGLHLQNVNGMSDGEQVLLAGSIFMFYCDYLLQDR